jgi:hypothetical protein
VVHFLCANERSAAFLLLIAFLLLPSALPCFDNRQPLARQSCRSSCALRRKPRATLILLNCAMTLSTLRRGENHHVNDYYSYLYTYYNDLEQNDDTWLTERMLVRYCARPRRNIRRRRCDDHDHNVSILVPCAWRYYRLLAQCTSPSHPSHALYIGKRVVFSRRVHSLDGALVMQVLVIRGLSYRQRPCNIEHNTRITTTEVISDEKTQPFRYARLLLLLIVMAH